MSAAICGFAADFGDMKSWALNLGARYFLSDSGTVRAYVAGYLGADRMDAMHARLAVSDMLPPTPEIFLPQQTRFDAGVEGGLSWALSNQTDINLSVGAQYVDSRSAQTNAFAPLGVNEVSFTDPHWSIPVDVGVSFRF